MPENSASPKAVVSQYERRAVIHTVVKSPSGKTAYVHPDRKMGDPKWWEGKVINA